MANPLVLKVKMHGPMSGHANGQLSFEGDSLFLEHEDGQKVTAMHWHPLPSLYILFVAYDQSHKVVVDCLLPKETSKNLKQKSFIFDPLDHDAAKSWAEAMNAEVYKGIKKSKHLKVIINPFSGTGKAKKIYESQVRPIFEKAQCTFDAIYTEQRNHARDLAKSLDLSTFDAIVVISGDGIVHEVVNGLLTRDDGKHLDIPLGVIPGGSGNALSICLLGETKGLSPSHAALNVIKGKPLKADVCSVQQGDTRYFSFLSQSFGIIADLDIGTEHLRWMGDTRFTYGSLKCIMQGRRYPCELAVKLSEKDLSVIKEQYRNSYNNNESSTNENNNSTTENDISDTNNHVYGSIVDVYGSINDPVPDDWSVFTDDICLFYAGKAPWMSKGALFFPCALPADGNVDMCIGWKDKLTKFQSIEVLGKIDKGTHIDTKMIDYYKVKAYRVTPKSQEGIISIDGEKVPFSPFQVEVHEKLVNFLSVDGKYVPSGV
ncbi:4042_t:CDS:2 [Ambispora gerdemannii]|uniref:4042_t:CDS:1 n=1 Tax=Ambispora gerdemannii TaxID=144530 RepID=A0A9N8VGZ1_9GLOM|nr:4042_t:CDS:2 [Ambispora gerdemannii]